MGLSPPFMANRKWFSLDAPLQSRNYFRIQNEMQIKSHCPVFQQRRRRNFWQSPNLHSLSPITNSLSYRIIISDFKEKYQEKRKHMTLVTGSKFIDTMTSEFQG